MYNEFEANAGDPDARFAIAKRISALLSEQVRELEREQRDEERVDELLKKIHDEGISTLKRSEREFLKRISGRN